MASQASPSLGHRQIEEVYAKRQAFYVNINWEPGTASRNRKYVQEQMYVESLVPASQTQELPIILIHGDFHSSTIWLTKPDKKPGWASFFLNKGYHVYVVDLPPVGRSNYLRNDHKHLTELKNASANVIEQEFTAPEYFHSEVGHRWPSAIKHDKWSGTGRRGDWVFDSYCASLTPLCFTPEERQTQAQNALKNLLYITGRSILIGEGSGATMAWLAADVASDLVAGVAAIEPPGPPFCANRAQGGRLPKYSTYTSYDSNRLPYGLANIPLTYDPPVRLVPGHLGDGHAHPRLDLALYKKKTGEEMILQRWKRDEVPVEFVFLQDISQPAQDACVRKLVNLKKMAHIVFTAEASSHAAYDQATVHFMHQAGLSLSCGILKDYGVCGNGHLMFLETNSDDVAAMVVRWIERVILNGTEPTVYGALDQQPRPEVVVLDQASEDVAPEVIVLSPEPTQSSTVWATECQMVDLKEPPMPAPCDDLFMELVNYKTYDVLDDPCTEGAQVLVEANMEAGPLIAPICEAPEGALEYKPATPTSIRSESPEFFTPPTQPTCCLETVEGFESYAGEEDSGWLETRKRKRRRRRAWNDVASSDRHDGAACLGIDPRLLTMNDPSHLQEQCRNRSALPGNLFMAYPGTREASVTMTTDTTDTQRQNGLEWSTSGFLSPTKHGNWTDISSQSQSQSQSQQNPRGSSAVWADVYDDMFVFGGGGGRWSG